MQIDGRSLVLFKSRLVPLFIEEGDFPEDLLALLDLVQRTVYQFNVLFEGGGLSDVFEHLDNVVVVELFVVEEFNQVLDNHQFAQSGVGQFRVAAHLVEKGGVVGTLVDGAVEQLLAHVGRIVEVAFVKLVEQRHVRGVVVQNLVVVEIFLVQIDRFFTVLQQVDAAERVVAVRLVEILRDVLELELFGDDTAHGIENAGVVAVDHREGVGVGDAVEVLRETVDLVIEVAGILHVVLDVEVAAVFLGVDKLIESGVDGDGERVAVGGHDVEFGLGGADGKLRQGDVAGVVLEGEAAVFVDDVGGGHVGDAIEQVVEHEQTYLLSRGERSGAGDGDGRLRT